MQQSPRKIFIQNQGSIPRFVVNSAHVYLKQESYRGHKVWHLLLKQKKLPKGELLSEFFATLRQRKTKTSVDYD